MNEARNLPWLAERMPRGITEILLVDGRSVDDTVAVARSLWPDVRVVQQTRRGKGNALACGFEAAAGEIIVMIDADGSMDPGEIPYFVAALTGGADFAKGSRFIDGGGSSDITRFRAAGNHLLNGLTRLVHKTGYTDLCYGYNAFWSRILPVLDLDAGRHQEETGGIRWGDGFEVETLINIRVHLAGLMISEVPSYETPRLHGASNLNAISDGCRVLRTIARESHTLRRGAHLRREVVANLVQAQPNVAPATADDQDASALGAEVVDITDGRDEFDLIDLATYERGLQARAPR
jgi:glycosyltransferase involved in cell wall biosynthesis